MEAVQRQLDARLQNKQGFDEKHRLQPQKIEEGDW